MTQLRIGPTNFYYELHGKGNPLVLIPGYSCDHTLWKYMLPFLSQHYQVLIFDNVGIGQTSDNNLPLDLERMADETILLAESLGLEKPYILGHSMGGAIAQIIAKKYEEKINKLIIVNSAAKINNRSLIVLNNFLTMIKEKFSFDTILDSSFPWFFSADYLSDPKKIISYKAEILNNPFPPTLEALERQFKALQQFDSTAWVSTINSPTLIIANESDIICLPSECEQLNHHIPNSKLARLPGGHTSPIECPELLNKAIVNFL